MRYFYQPIKYNPEPAPKIFRLNYLTHHNLLSISQFYYYKPRQAYRVTLKVLMANRVNYKIVSTVFVPQSRVMNYINTTVALTY
jgi:hypothetical protein